MSAFFKVPLDGELREVEISRSGEMSFSGDVDQLEYDLAFAAMGGNKSEILNFWDEWQGTPISIIINPLQFNIMPRHLVCLAADWAEHALELFKKRHPSETRPIEAIVALRKFVDGEIDKNAFDEIALRARDSVFDYRPPDRYIVSAAHEATMVASFLYIMEHNNYNIEFKYEQMKTAIRTVSLNSDTETGGRVKPGNWQIRRFVHVMENLQTGKPWPRVEETP